MIQVLVLAGFAWLLMREPSAESDGDNGETNGGGGSTWTDPNLKEDGTCKEGYAFNSEGVCVPFEVILPYVDIERWSGEYSASGDGGDYVVWFYETGVKYEDDSVEYDPPQIVIGNPGHDGFLSASVGGITIGDNEHVQVFPDLASASAKADEMANPSSSGPASGVESEETLEEFVAEKETFAEGGYVDFGKGADSLGQNSGGEVRLYDM